MLRSSTQGLFRGPRTDRRQPNRIERRKYRSCKDGRQIGPIIGREEHRIYRMRVNPNDNSQWVSYVPRSGKKMELDSYVHRFGRELGFKALNDGEIAETDGRMHNVLRRTNHVTYKPKSTLQRARSQSYFECYVLSAHPNDPYAKFLQQIKDLDPQDSRNIEIKKPSNQLVRSWMFHLRDDEDLNATVNDNEETKEETQSIRGRMNKKSTIECHLKNLSGVLLEFGGEQLGRSSEIQKLLKDWEIEDDVNRAESFLFEEVLPKLYDALFKQVKMSHERKIHLWARLLGQIATISRSSDVTGEYCPLIKDVEFPKTSIGYMPDGTPYWVQIVWTDWKSRPARYKKAPHKIKLYANPLNLAFCPVHWLHQSWMHRKDLEDEKAPIYLPLTSGQYQRQLINLFDKIDSNVVPSSHSIRRSAAQWAARCGADINIIRNVGRWESLEHLITYIAEGHEIAMHKMAENNDVDPIFGFWCFNFDTQVTSINTTLQQALAMQSRAN